MSVQSFNFDDLTPIEIPVSIKGKKYLLREASEDAAVKYRNACFREARFGTDGKLATAGNIADAEPLLVSLCLFELYDHEGKTKERPVSIVEVKSWPSRIVKPIFEKIQEISSLREEETREVLEKRLKETQQKLSELNGHTDDTKNLQSAMTGNSV